MSAEPIQRAVPALDLKAQYATIRGEIEAALLKVFESQYFIMGPEVAAFEAEVAQFCRTPHAIGCASGSDALLIPLMAWNVGPGDEVITTPYSFFATASAVWRVGAKPVFVDILPDSYNIDPAKIERAITPRTKAIIPVHLYGQCAEMERIAAIARPRGIKILEDAAQAIGAAHASGPAGSLGDATAYSFYPSKNLGGFGDGGLMTTADAGLAKSLARLRVHGMEPRYHHHEVGINSRLDALQAAVLRIKLRYLSQWTEGRRAVASRYKALFTEAGLLGEITLPIEQPRNYHVYNQYIVRVDAERRDALRAYLSERQVGTEIYYPIPLHLQVCFQTLNYGEGDFPESERAAKQTLALPIYPELTEDAQRTVVDAIATFFGRKAIGHGIPKPHVATTGVRSSAKV